MQQQPAGCPPTRSLSIFVGPATVISQPASAEQIRLFFGRRWIVDQHHQNLAAIVFRRTFVIVPLLFGSIDAVADKYEVSIHDYISRLRAGEDNKIIRELERFSFSR